MSDAQALDKSHERALDDVLDDGGMPSPEEMASRRSVRISADKYSLPSTYSIKLEEPIPKLDSATAKAFEVTDSSQKASKLYALLLPNNLPIRFSNLQKMKSIFHESISNIVDAGFTEVGGGKYGNFAIICEHPPGTTLAEYIIDASKIEKPENNENANEYLLDDDFITRQIVEPLNDVLKALAEQNISHGRINHESIYIYESEGVAKIKLLEAVSEPCGLSQPHQYETIARAQAMPLGKGEANAKSDYFALGMLVYYCMFGHMPESGDDIDAYTSRRLSQGSYATYLPNIEVNSRMVDILRGLLSDIPEDRWGYQQVNEWVRGKRFNLIRPSFRKESVRSYQFENTKHFTRRSLAHIYNRMWKKTAPDLRSKKIMKWLELSVGEHDQSEEIYSFINSTGGEKSRSQKDDDELTAKTLISLDPTGPIRLRNISVHIDGIGTLLADAWSKRDQSTLQDIRQILSFNLPDFKVVKDIDKDRSSERWLLQRLHTFISIESYGFGIERCLYDLNSSLPCQSQLLGNQFIIDLPNLLNYLSDNAARLEEFNPVDRHVAAFITSRLEMSKKLNPIVPGLILSKQLKESMSKLIILYYAQKRTKSSRLVGLTEWVANKVKEDFLSVINSKSLQEDFSKDMHKAAKSGSISSVVDVITKGGYFTKNRTGLMEARAEYYKLTSTARQYNQMLDNAKKYKTFYLTGLYLAKVVSILVFVLTLSILAL